MDDQGHFHKEELDEYHRLVCEALGYAGPSPLQVEELQTEYPGMLAFLKKVPSSSRRPRFLMEYVYDDSGPLSLLSNEEFLVILPDLVSSGLSEETDSIVFTNLVNRFIDISERSDDWHCVRALLTDQFLERLRQGLLQMIPQAWEGRRVGKRSDSVNAAFA